MSGPSSCLVKHNKTKLLTKDPPVKSSSHMYELFRIRDVRTVGVGPLCGSRVIDGIS